MPQHAVLVCLSSSHRFWSARYCHVSPSKAPFSSTPPKRIRPFGDAMLSVAAPYRVPGPEEEKSSFSQLVSWKSVASVASVVCAATGFAARRAQRTTCKEKRAAVVTERGPKPPPFPPRRPSTAVDMVVEEEERCLLCSSVSVSLLKGVLSSYGKLF